jgi:hypothetical protein
MAGVEFPAWARDISLLHSIQYLYGVVTAFKNCFAFNFGFTQNILENVYKMYEIWLQSRVAVHGAQFGWEHSC